MILVVDDCRDNAFLLSRLLRMGGFESATAYSGEDLFGVLRSSPELPQLIILDVRMPGADGWQCLEQLRGNPLWKNIPVVMYSAETEGSGLVRAKRLGAQDYLVKGMIAWNEFLQRINVHLAAPPAHPVAPINAPFCRAG